MVSLYLGPYMERWGALGVPLLGLGYHELNVTIGH